jgi:hypothetical protein
VYDHEDKSVAISLALIPELAERGNPFIAGAGFEQTSATAYRLVEMYGIAQTTTPVEAGAMMSYARCGASKRLDRRDGAFRIDADLGVLQPCTSIVEMFASSWRSLVQVVVRRTACARGLSMSGSWAP